MLPFRLSPLEVLAEGLEVVLLPLELCRGVDLAGAHLLDRHLDVVHPLHHLGVPGENKHYYLKSRFQSTYRYSK